jgi:peptide/nickel transport system permease protein
MGGILQGDLGRSLWTKESILLEFARRFPVTLELTLLTIIISVTFGIGVGILSAIRQETWIDYIGRVVAIMALAMPVFWLAILVVVIPAIYWRWTPLWTYVTLTADPLENLKIMIFPALVFGVSRAGPIMRIMRSSMLEVQRQDYIRTAWAKGLRERTVVFKHAIKNALIPVVSIIGLQIHFYLGGSVIIETIFRLPGMGSFFVEALIRLDYPVVQSMNLIGATFGLLLNLMVDFSYAYLDPRIRYR